MVVLSIYIWAPKGRLSCCYDSDWRSCWELLSPRLRTYNGELNHDYLWKCFAITGTCRSLVLSQRKRPQVRRFQKSINYFWGFLSIRGLATIWRRYDPLVTLVGWWPSWWWKRSQLWKSGSCWELQCWQVGQWRLWISTSLYLWEGVLDEFKNFLACVKSSLIRSQEQNKTRRLA